MRKVIKNKNGGRVRRELAEYILNCSYKDLSRFICALETDNSIPNPFSCDVCKNAFGNCLCDDNSTKCCETRLEQYDNLSYTQTLTKGV